MSKKSGSGFRFVTLDGEIINISGAITGGKYKNKTANLLERRNEIAALEKEIENSFRGSFRDCGNRQKYRYRDCRKR